MLLHCSDKELTMSDIRREFIKPFKLTSLEDLYVLPVSMINCPVMVVPDMIGEHVNSNERFLAVVPSRMMNTYFLRYLKGSDEQFEVDMSDEGRFDGNAVDLTDESSVSTDNSDESDSDTQQSDDYDDNEEEDEYVEEGYGSDDGDGFSDEEIEGSDEEDFYERTDAYYRMDNVVDENGVVQAMI